MRCDVLLRNVYLIRSADRQDEPLYAGLRKLLRGGVRLAKGRVYKQWNSNRSLQIFGGFPSNRA